MVTLKIILDNIFALYIYTLLHHGASAIVFHPCYSIVVALASKISPRSNGESQIYLLVVRESLHQTLVFP